MKSLHIFNKIQKLPKKLISLLAVLVLATPLVTGFATASNHVTLEGHVKSLNSTTATSSTEYGDVTDLKVDEVAQIQLWHHNREAPGGEAATNTNVRFSVPSESGLTQTVTGTSSSDNGNTITDTTQINLSLERARLEYIPGSAKFRYNKGAVDGIQSCITEMEFPAESCYATVPISDNVVTSGVNLDQVRGTPLHGCNAYHETVIIQVRSVADVVSVNKYVRHVGQSASDWATSTTAQPGDDLEYLIRFKNEGNTNLENVMVGDNLPKYNSYVENTTMIQNSTYPNGILSDNNNITRGGINVGRYTPGAAGYVWFTASLDTIEAYEKCGIYEIANVGVVRPEGMNEFYNTALVTINVECDEEEEVDPVYACTNLVSEKIGSLRFRFTTSTNANPTDRVSVKSYHYNFGDGSEVLVTDRSTVEHTYSKAGNYSASVDVTFTVDGSDEKVSSERCKVTVSTDKPPVQPPAPTPTPPTTIPVTGAGSIAGLMAAVAGIGSVAHRKLTLRRQ